MSLAIGAFLGPYRVVAHIGSGGMGEVQWGVRVSPGLRTVGSSPSRTGSLQGNEPLFTSFLWSQESSAN
jgi:hypothetical protein